MVVQSGVFVLQGKDSLVAMQPEQFATEVDFQSLLSRFPSLLVGDQIDSDVPRRFLLVQQELSIGHEDAISRWSLDHLFLDQDGIPTLVEVKRHTDSRIRREVVGQMLDYAANFKSSWTAERVKSALEARLARDSIQYQAVFEGFLDADSDFEQFWVNVDDNIKLGKMRLLFVADRIPSELRNIVEFLNKHMQPTEVLALELRQFGGQGLRTIVPVLFGQTQDKVARKESTRGERWTEERLMAAFDSKYPKSEVAVARAVLDWMKRSGFALCYGTGRANGSVYPAFKPKGVAINPAYLSTEGKIWLQLKSLEGKPAFGNIDERRELLSRFGAVDGSGLDLAAVDGWPTISLSCIASDPRGTEKVISAFQWIADRVKAAS